MRACSCRLGIRSGSEEEQGLASRAQGLAEKGEGQGAGNSRKVRGPGGRGQGTVVREKGIVFCHVQRFNRAKQNRVVR